MYGKIIVAAVLLIGITACTTVSGDVNTLEGMPLVFSDTFDGDTAQWTMTDANAWKVGEVDGDQRLVLKGGSKYKPPVCSPYNIAWTKDLKVSDFILEVECKQTGKEYGHRDLCFFFGKQDAAHFYYVHLATKADAHANSIFLVNGEPRKSIAKERTRGTDWTQEPHKIRIQRDTAAGTILVFFDDMENPVMRTEDTHFLSGPVGLGSFDDSGWFDNVRVWGTIVK